MYQNYLRLGLSIFIKMMNKKIFVLTFVLSFFIQPLLAEELHLLLSPQSEAVVGNVRIQALSDSLVRLELKGPKGFEDRPTFHIVERNWQGIPIEKSKLDTYELIKTSNYTIKVPVNANSLSNITIMGEDGSQLWSMPEDSKEFLENNRYWIPHPKEKTTAWAIVDTPRIIPATWGYNLAPSNSEFYETNGWDLSNNAQDIYVFLPDGNGKKLREDYIKLTGRSELIPLYALGGWYSRWYPYSDNESLEVIDTYRNKNIPLNAFVVDTNWRVGGSTGYNINKRLFPDMPWFLDMAHSNNIKIMFNDHPVPQSEILDPVEVEYRNTNLRNLFKMGLDIWWYDRNWYVHLSPPKGIDINKEVFGMYIYKWITQDFFPSRRPLIMANVDGIDTGVLNRAPNLAAHRYPIQWTGDIPNNFSSLKRELKNALYSGIHAPFPYISSDLGGFLGRPTNEEYMRWMEYGAFSPIFRPHCIIGTTRDPWSYGKKAEEVVRRFVQMRMRLLPVFYTGARENYDTGEPILRRCDLEYPTYKEAERSDQYLLGKDILVAPIVEQGGSRTVWVPEGAWINVWNGDSIKGPNEIKITMELDQMPIFVKSGSIIPLAPDMQYVGEKPWEPVTLDIYPSLENKFKFILYEDDGATNDYKNGMFSKTSFEASLINKKLILKITPEKSLFKGSLDTRSWIARIHKPLEWNSFDIKSVTIDGIPANYNKYPKNEGSVPFAVTGSSADADVIQINIPVKATEMNRMLEVDFL